jgi:hypothetical protein
MDSMLDLAHLLLSEFGMENVNANKWETRIVKTNQ